MISEKKQETVNNLVEDSGKERKYKFLEAEKKICKSGAYIVERESCGGIKPRWRLDLIKDVVYLCVKEED